MFGKKKESLTTRFFNNIKKWFIIIIVLLILMVLFWNKIMSISYIKILRVLKAADSFSFWTIIIFTILAVIFIIQTINEKVLRRSMGDKTRRLKASKEQE